MFEDIAGDALLDGAIGGASNPGVTSATVHIYRDNGDGTPGAGDPQVGGSPVTTGGGGAYTSPNVGNGTYWVVVDSKTVGSTQDPVEPLTNLWAEQTYGSAGARCSNGAGGTVTLGAAGGCYGGQRGAQSDDASTLATAEHVTRVVVAGGANASGIDFGFSFNVVTTTRDGDDDAGAANRTVQGSLRQFIQNSGAINGTNAMRFVPAVPTNASGSGGNWWEVTVTGSVLPTISDSGTTVDGAAYCAWTDGTQGCLALTSTRDTNSGSSGNPDIAAKSIGTGVDGIEGTGDEPQLPTYNKPELEINGGDLGVILQIAASSTTIRRIAVYNNPSSAEAILVSAGTGSLVTQNFIGPRAGGSDPGSGSRLASAVWLTTGASDITDNFVAYTETTGLTLGNASLAQGNDIYQAALSGATGDGITSESSTGQSIVIRQNRIDRSGAYGVETWGTPGPFTVENNTVLHSGQGGGVEGGGIRIFGTGSTIRYNVITANAHAGIAAVETSVGTNKQNRITKNAIYANGSLSIDLDVTNTGAGNPNGDGVTPNNGATNASLPNIGMDYAVITNAALSASSLHIEGYVGTGATKIAGTHTIEVFKASNDGNNNGPVIQGDGLSVPHGEGRWFINTCTTAAAGTFICDLAVPPAAGLVVGDAVTASATDTNSNTSELGANFTVTAAQADLSLTKTDNPDPAPAGGELLYTLLVTNNGPNNATNVVVTDNLPGGVTLASATPSQGSCSGMGPVTCNLGGILNTGTASIEILVVTPSSAGSITNNASVTAAETDPTPANNSASAATTVVIGGTTDIPLTLYRRIHGFVDYTVTGGSLRTASNGSNPCAVGASSTAALSGIPAGSTVTGAYLYWSGSGSTVDNQVTLDAAALTADRTWQGNYVTGATTYDFFGGFKDVTAQVQAKRNGNYTFSGLTVTTGNPFCANQTVLAGWSLIVIYQDNSLTGKTLVLYDGFDITRNDSSAFTLSGIFATAPPQGKTTVLVWEGDDTLSGANESLKFDGSALSDALDPVNNVYNSTINSLGVTTSWGVDLDTYDVSGLIHAKDTLATMTVSTDADMVIANAVVLEVKSNVITGTVFEDVNYGGGAGRSLATAVAGAPGFTVPRSGTTVELYNSGGSLLRSATTGADGGYGFAGLIDGDYVVRAVNGTVTSSRPGAVAGLWPVQTYRTDASGGTAVGVTNEIGGASPASQDAGANVTNANLGSFIAQSKAPARITTGIAVTDVDFGYNFDTVVNRNDTGQGGLRQALTNANTLGGEASMAQAGFRKDAAGVNQALPAGSETTLFMIPAAQLTAGVAVITPATALPQITGANTIVDGTTQTVGIGDTNAGQLGTGGTVGADSLALPTVARPEVQITGSHAFNTLDLQVNNAAVRGLALYNGQHDINVGNGFSGAVIEQNIVGATATSFADPGAATRSVYGIFSAGGDSGIVRNNLIGYTEANGVFLFNASDNWQILSNEIRGNGLVPANNGDAVWLNASTGAQVTGNLLADSYDANVEGPGAGLGAQILNNTVATTQTGDGIRESGSACIVSKNIVSGSAGYGIAAGGSGTTVSLNTATSNTRGGIRSSGTLAILDRNQSSSNSGPGITLAGHLERATRNSTWGNTGLGLDLLAPAGVNPNAGAYDVSVANNGMNYPVFTSAILGGGSVTITGYVGSAPGQAIFGGATVEIFKADDSPADQNGPVVLGDGRSVPHGEGRTYIGTLTADANGRFSGSLPVGGLALGDSITGTAIDTTANTSEFAANEPLLPLAIAKKAYQANGTPLPQGGVVPRGALVKFLLYVNNPGPAVADVSIKDALDPAFAYVTGSIRFTNAPASCAQMACTPAEEAAIFAAANTGTAGTDGVDGDVISFAGTTTYAGNQDIGNLQLDIAAGKVWAMVFTVRMR